MNEVGININEGKTEVETVEGATEVSVELSNTIQNIAEIPSALYGAFTKILAFLSQGMTSNDIFFIKDGKLNTKKSAGFIYSDMSSLFNENSIEIIDPATAVKLLSLLKGGEKVLFLKDNTENNYIVSNIANNEPMRSIVLPIPEVAENEVAVKPDLGNLIKEFEIDTEKIEDAINASKITGSSYFILNFDDNNDLLSIETSNKKYKDIYKKGEPTISLKLFDLMLISKPDSYKIKLFKKNEDYWIQTVSDVNLVEIEYMEKVDEISDFDAFML
jgi:copper chaperone CopZ